MNKKRIFEDIKVLKANHKTLREFAKEKYIDEEGFANIHIYLDSSQIYNRLTNPLDPELSDEIISYIDKEAYFIPAEYPIRVILHSNEELDEAKIEKKLKEHYWKLLVDKDDDLKRNGFLSIILFVVGILFLSTFFVLQNIPQTKDLFNEIFSIIGSFAIWESADCFLLTRNRLKIEYLNDAQLALLTLKTSDK
ncbi:MAG: hypothetical protein MJ228_04255 [Bacilli bacterium]|nr:hypothetical protein [Bacilli bacterium]